MPSLAEARRVIEREIADGFEFCCDSCPFAWADLLALVDVAEAAEEFVEARFLGTRERLVAALKRVSF